MKYFFVTLLFFILSSNIYSQDEKFTGYATSFVNQDSIIQINTFGFADKEKKILYSANTIQPIASVSKTLIGISLMIAKDKGLINLDKDINEYLDFHITNPKIKEENKITLRHLATHTSGIIDNEKVYKSAYNYGVDPHVSLRDFLIMNLCESGKKYSKNNFHKSKAGIRYAYSNIGSALAAYIIERTSGLTFDIFTKENILIPLGMTNSGWFYKDIDVLKHSVLYDEKDKAIKPYSCATYPDGSLKSTITDLSIYLIELIKGYNHNSELISKESWTELFEKNFTNEMQVININEKEPNSGIFMAYFKSGKIGHTGSDIGVSSIMMFDPKTNTGQIFMSNEDLVSENLEEFKKIWNGIK